MSVTCPVTNMERSTFGSQYVGCMSIARPTIYVTNTESPIWMVSTLVVWVSCVQKFMLLHTLRKWKATQWISLLAINVILNMYIKVCKTTTYVLKHNETILSSHVLLRSSWRMHYVQQRRRKARQIKEEKGKGQIKKTDGNCERKRSKVYKPSY